MNAHVYTYTRPGQILFFVKEQRDFYQVEKHVATFWNFETRKGAPKGNMISYVCGMSLQQCANILNSHLICWLLNSFCNRSGIPVHLKT